MKSEERAVQEMFEIATADPIWKRVPKLGWAAAGLRDGFQNKAKDKSMNQKYQELYDAGYDLGKKCR